jgi:hypothetical protein
MVSMNHLSRRLFFIITGLVIFLWPGVVRDACAQSVRLDNVTVVRSFEFVQVNFSFEGLDGYDIDNYGLVVFVDKYTFDPDDGIMKYMPLDTLNSASDEFKTMIENNEFYYLDFSSNHDTGPERYSLRLEDFSETILGFFTSGHQTIFLNEVVADQIDICSGAITVNWKNYGVYSISGATGDEQEEPFFTHNRIMYLPPGGTVDQFAVTLDFNASNDYQFAFNDGPGEYLIWVQAVEFDGNNTILRYSDSNFRRVTFESPVLTSLDMIKVDVINNRDIEVVFEAVGGQAGDLDNFIFDVYRANALDGEFLRLDGDIISIGLGMPSSSVGLYSFTDSQVPDLQAGPYYYFVVAHLVECEQEFMVSPVVSSLFLEGNIAVYTEDILEVVLNGAYYPGGMDYQLYRKLPWDADWEEVGFPGPGLSFTDNLSMYIEDLAGEILYRLEASSGADMFVSNVVSIRINVGLEVFNAFRPASQLEDNRTFKPRLRGVTPTLYRLLIFNNWGQEVYSFTNQFGSLDGWDGWDGRASDGSEAPQGVYGYRLEYQIGTGQQEEVMGTVMLIR